jgi:inosose dehydratase
VGNILDQSKIGLVPLNWRYESDNMVQFLSGISNYGFKGIQISGPQAESPEFLGEMKSNDIAPAEQYLAIRCDQDGPMDGSETESAETIRQAVLAGVEMIVFAVDGSVDRDRCAGRADSGPQLTSEAFTKLAHHVEKFARSASDQGIKSSFHPHAATYIETERETKVLMSQMASGLVGLCLDVGHWIVGGGDPIKAVKDYGDRITHVHVKDVSGEVLKNMLSGKIETMNTAVEEFKLFVPAGTGVLKMRELFSALDEVGFHGWLMSEQDSAWEPSEAASGISMVNMKATLA